MADVYLRSNAPYGASDVILATSAATTPASTSGGGVWSPPKVAPRKRKVEVKRGQVEARVDFRFACHIAADATIGVEVSLPAPALGVVDERREAADLEALALLADPTDLLLLAMSDEAAGEWEARFGPAG